MKTIERSCPCGASLSYSDEDWRVQMALEEWELAHRHESTLPAPADGALEEPF